MATLSPVPEPPDDEFENLTDPDADAGAKPRRRPFAKKNTTKKTWRWRAAVGVAAMIALVPAAARADEGGHWHKHIVTFRDRSGYGPEVAIAVAAWNAQPANITLVPALRRHRADITITTGQLDNGVAGEAEYPPSSHVWLSPDLRQADDPGPLGHSAATEVVEHELGHALGLTHLPGPCSLMDADGFITASDCDVSSTLGRCGPQPTDVWRLVLKYGWRPGQTAQNTLRQPAFGTCQILPHEGLFEDIDSTQWSLEDAP